MGLFSTVYHSHTESTKMVPYEKTVIEKRAPTDDSIKLADEYSKKAEERLMGAFKLENNSLGEGITGNVFIFQNRLTMYSSFVPCLKYAVRFKLNEKNFSFEFELDSTEVQDLMLLSERDADLKIFQMVFKKISEIIALELIKITGTKAIGLRQDYHLD